MNADANDRLGEANDRPEVDEIFMLHAAQFFFVIPCLGNQLLKNTLINQLDLYHNNDTTPGLVIYNILSSLFNLLSL